MKSQEKQQNSRSQSEILGSSWKNLAKVSGRISRETTAAFWGGHPGKITEQTLVENPEGTLQEIPYKPSKRNPWSNVWTNPTRNSGRIPGRALTISESIRIIADSLGEKKIPQDKLLGKSNMNNSHLVQVWRVISKGNQAGNFWKVPRKIFGMMLRWITWEFSGGTPGKIRNKFWQEPGRKYKGSRYKPSKKTPVEIPGTLEAIPKEAFAEIPEETIRKIAYVFQREISKGIHTKGYGASGRNPVKTSGRIPRSTTA